MKIGRGKQLFGPRAAHGLLLGAVCALIVACVQSLGRLEGSERAAIDTFFHARGHLFPHPPIIILAVDEETIKRAGSWPLPRSMYADVVRRLSRAGAKTIAFDLVFLTRPRQTASSSTPKALQSTLSGTSGIDAGAARDDEILVQACRAARRVVQASVLRPEFSDAVPSGKSPSFALPARFAIDDRGAPCRNAIAESSTHAALLASAAGLGHITVFPEKDGSYRRIPHLLRHRGTVYPSLALATAAHALGVAPRDIRVEPRSHGSEVLLAGHRVPLDENGEIMVNWLGPNGAIPTYTFTQLFNGALRPGDLRDRIVMIGITAGGAYEHYATPFSPNQAAVELQANALDDILSNRVLREATPVWRWALLACFPVLAGALCGGRSAKINGVLLLLMAIGLWTMGALLFSRAHFYLPVAAPILATVMTCAACVGQRQLRDARELRQTMQGLQRAEERYALAAQGANDGLWDWNLQTQEIYFSPRWKAMIGHAENEIGARPESWLERVHAEDRARLESEIEAHIAGRTPHLENEHRLRHKDGAYRWMLCRGLRVLDAANRPSRMAGSQSDITARKDAEALLLHNAFSDDLTGLPNRTRFLDRLDAAIARAQHEPAYSFAVLFFDVDRFKNVNDSLGHERGNELLIEIARRLQSTLRPSDTAARIGGDEFAILLEIGQTADATYEAARIQHEMARPFDLKKSGASHTVFTTVSIGIALSSAGYDRPEDVLRDADTAMYRAKAAGLGRFCVFDRAMHDRVVALLALETDLRLAVGRNEFRAHYQPIVSLQNGRISGFEALVRWPQAQRGIVMPGEFIAVAEDTGLILPIDRWVLREACRQTKAWHHQWRHLFPTLPLSINVNLSSKQFAQPNLVEHIEGALHEAEFDPSHLKLEITEGAIMENPQAATAMLQRLKAMGIQLCIDDFGTGYSSLSYLHRFPLDVLKVDRSFVQLLDAEGESSEIVRAITTLALSLRMKIVAEGIETPRQLELLRALGCHYGQGYLFSKPLDQDDATNFLSRDLRW